MTKSVYLNESVQQQLTRIKTVFKAMKYDPTDIGIIAAALTVYEEMLMREASQGRSFGQKPPETIPSYFP